MSVMPSFRTVLLVAGPFLLGALLITAPVTTPARPASALAPAAAVVDGRPHDSTTWLPRDHLPERHQVAAQPTEAPAEDEDCQDEDEDPERMTVADWIALAAVSVLLLIGVVAIRDVT